MKVLLTGASGFLGNAVQFALQQNDLFTIGRASSNHLHCDLTLEIPHLPTPFHTVIHMAGKAHMIPKTVAEKQAFFDVNVKGTANLLQSLTAKPPQYFVFISSVAVYGLSEGVNIDEKAPLLAEDPYGLSKLQAEELIVNWCNTHQVKYTILRLPLIVGHGAPGNLAAFTKSIHKGYYLNIAGGIAKRSAVLAIDVAQIILPAAAIGGIFNLTDGYHPSLKELSDTIACYLQKSKPIRVPKGVIKPVAYIGDLIGDKFPINSAKLSKLTSSLTFDDTLARTLLAWQPTPVLNIYRSGN